MSPIITLHQLPPEIIEEILAECGYDKGTLDVLALTCHTLSIRTRPHRFTSITLHDNNFNDFVKLTHLVPWNTIVPHIRRLALGTKMFPLSHCHLNKLRSEPSWNFDLTGWAAQFGRLWMLDLRGMYWVRLPPCVAAALLRLQVEHLVVCLTGGALNIEDFKDVVAHTIRPKTLTISGPPWSPESIPSLPAHVHEDSSFYIHYLHLDETAPTAGLVDWLKTYKQPPSVIHLYIKLPRSKFSAFGLALLEIFHVVSPQHLHLKLPSLTHTCFEFPVGALTGLKTFQISSISNDFFLASDNMPDEEGTRLSDVSVVSSLLEQLSVLQDKPEVIQLDSICAHTNIMFGRVPEILLGSYPNLELLNLTLRSGKGTRGIDLDEWLDGNPFSSLQARGVQLRMEAVGADPIFLGPLCVLDA